VPNCQWREQRHSAKFATIHANFDLSSPQNSDSDTAGPVDGLRFAVGALIAHIQYEECGMSPSTESKSPSPRSAASPNVELDDEIACAIVHFIGGWRTFMLSIRPVSSSDGFAHASEMFPEMVDDGGFDQLGVCQLATSNGSGYAIELYVAKSSDHPLELRAILHQQRDHFAWSDIRAFARPSGIDLVELVHRQHRAIGRV